MRQSACTQQAPRIRLFSLHPSVEAQLLRALTSEETIMPMPFPIKQGHATNLKPKGRRSKRGGASSRQTLLKRKKGNG